MGRREFLRGAVGVVTVGFAGCTVLGGAGDADGEYTPTTEDHLAVAVGNLNTVALAVNEYRNQAGASPAETSFDADKPRERLATAQEAVDTAEEAAGNNQQSDIEAVRKYTDSVTGTVDAVVGLIDASDGLESARETLRADEVDTDSASDSLNSARTASSNAVTAREDAATALANADDSRLRRLGAEYDAMEDGLDQLAGYVIGVDGLTGGYSEQVAGIESLQTAQEHVETEAFESATESFSAAADAFERATSAFSEAMAEAVEALVEDLEYGDQQSRSLDNLSTGYVALLDSRDFVSAAETAIEDDAYDEARGSLEDANGAVTTAAETFETGAAILDQEFDAEFETAQTRTTAVSSLVDGYLGVLNARDNVTDAETAIENDAYDDARSSLDDASTAASTADETFAAGENAGGDLLNDAFDAARTRAGGIDALATGYVSLLDAHDSVTAAESAIEADEYEDARESLSTANDHADTADQTFATGEADTGAFFATEFETARDRATAIGSLAGGYLTLLDARDHVDAGQSAFTDEQFEDASEAFETATTQSQDAQTTFDDGSAADDEGLFTAEFDSATQRANAVNALSSAYATMVEARQIAEDGREFLEDQEFDDASDEFDQADSQLGSAETTLTDGQTAADDEFESEFDRALCQIEHLRTAVDHFIAAANAGSNGNRASFAEERDAAEDALDAVSEC